MTTAALGVCLTLSLALTSCAGQDAAQNNTPTATEPAARAVQRNEQAKAATVVDGDSVTLEGQTLTAKETGQSVLIVKNGGSAVLRDCTILKKGDAADAQQDNTSGVNAALVAESGGNLVMENCTVVTDGQGATAVAAVGGDACVVVYDSQITTKQAYSTGLLAADNGCVTAQSLKVQTAGAYSPLLYAGGEGGTMQAIAVQGQTYGTSAPCLIDEAALEVTDSQLVSYGAQGALVRAGGQLTLNQTLLTGEGGCGVMVYQKEERRARAEKQAVFSMQGGTLVGKQGPAVYVTNAQAAVTLANGATAEGEADVLVKAAAGLWGESGANGGQVQLTTERGVAGRIETDTISGVQREESGTAQQ